MYCHTHGTHVVSHTHVHMYCHTHTHVTCTTTLTCTCTGVRYTCTAHSRAHVLHVLSHTLICTCTSTHTVHIYYHTHSRVHIHFHITIHMYACILTYTYVLTYTHVHTCIYIHRHVYTHALPQKRTYIYTSTTRYGHTIASVTPVPETSVSPQKSDCTPPHLTFADHRSRTVVLGGTTHLCRPPGLVSPGSTGASCPTLPSPNPYRRDSTPPTGDDTHTSGASHTGPCT